MPRAKLLTYGLFVIVISQVMVYAYTQTEVDGANRQTTLRLFNQLVNQGNLALADELIAPEFVLHTSGATYNLGGSQALLTSLRTTIPDLTVSPELIMNDEAWVASHYTARGTHTGELALTDGSVVPPSNAMIVVSGIALMRFDQAGRLTEIWDEHDNLFFFQKAGMVPGIEGLDETPPDVTVAASLGVAVGDAPPAIEQANQAAVRSAFEAFDDDNLDALEDLYTTTYLHHGPDGETASFEAFMSALVDLRDAFLDSSITIDVLFAQGSFVASRVTIGGTFENPLTGVAGMDVIVPTGQRVEVSINSIHRFNERGKIVEAWHAYDRLSLFTQLGLLPPSQATAEASG